MNIVPKLHSRLRVQLISADITAAFQVLRKEGIEVLDLAQRDALTVTFTVSKTHIHALKSISARRGDDIRILSHIGLFWTLLSLKKRPVLVLGLAILITLSLFLPGRIMFIRVEGNQNVPTNQILESAARTGLTFGVSARKLRSEHIKNSLLSEIDQLQWLGVNTYGCVAVIRVLEREPQPQQELLPPVTSIVSAMDGIVTSVTVTSGNALCKPGDAVTAGQLLISGYADLGICQKGTQAKGQIMGLTERDLTVITPVVYEKRGRLVSTDHRFSLQIGKKRINFYKDSGILGTTCARIYERWYVSLPGGFVLPVSVIKQTSTVYESQQSKLDAAVGIADFAKQYLLDHMVSGQILASSDQLEQKEQTCIFYGHYACSESLGVIKIEEISEQYGKDPGTERQR